MLNTLKPIDSKNWLCEEQMKVIASLMFLKEKKMELSRDAPA